MAPEMVSTFSGSILSDNGLRKRLIHNLRTDAFGVAVGNGLEGADRSVVIVNADKERGSAVIAGYSALEDDNISFIRCKRLRLPGCPV